MDKRRVSYTWAEVMAMEIANFGGPIENEGQQAIAADQLSSILLPTHICAGHKSFGGNINLTVSRKCRTGLTMRA